MVALVTRIRAAGPLEERVLRRAGEVWTLTYEGKTLQLKHSKGLGDIAILLANPGKEVHVAELIAFSGERVAQPAAVALARMTEEELAALGVRRSAGPQGLPVLDARALEEYRARLAELHRELADAEESNDPGRVARAHIELDFIAGELAGAQGLGGRARSSGSPAERARKAVAWRIRDSVTKIGREHPALASHLRRFVKTGTFCAYAVPDGVPRWRVGF
jgi:non-specific serine/threonine protein kinase